MKCVFFLSGHHLKPKLLTDAEKATSENLDASTVKLVAVYANTIQRRKALEILMVDFDSRRSMCGLTLLQKVSQPFHKIITTQVILKQKYSHICTLG